MATPREHVTVEGREVAVSNPGKVLFPALGLTKMDLVRYYLSVMDGALRGCRDRPTIMKRYPNGIEGEFFYQKRVPAKRPDWIRTAHVRFPSMRTADFIAPADAAHVVWMVNLACLELHPWPVRAPDVDHPDELRIDLDPTPGIPFQHVREVAMLVRDVLAEHGLAGFPMTSGSRGMHVLARIEPRWEFLEVRRAALAFSREVERRSPLATTAWWKEERVGVFLDYNMNARDRTLSSAYSIRPVPDARVAMPVTWEEVPTVDPAAFTVATAPARFAERGDACEGIDDRAGTLDSLLDLAARDEAGGLGDAPWPPHFPKQRGEPARVAPSRAKRRPDGPARRQPDSSRMSSKRKGFGASN
ncbi:MAG TPA: DNA polymerase domain-containing protein [Actinomycetota bacterium]